MDKPTAVHEFIAGAILMQKQCEFLLSRAEWLVYWKKGEREGKKREGKGGGIAFEVPPLILKA